MRYGITDDKKGGENKHDVKKKRSKKRDGTKRRERDRGQKRECESTFHPFVNVR
jgi:hypothetical protein